MATVKVVPLSAELLKQIESRDPAFATTVKGAWGDTLVSLTRYGAVALNCATGVPAGAIGIVEQWPGVVDVWAVADRTIDAVGLSAVKAAKRFLDTAAYLFKVRWFNALVRAADAKAVATAKVLGFDTALFLREYGPNREDFWLMTRKEEP